MHLLYADDLKLFHVVKNSDSAYFPYDTNTLPPNENFIKLVDFCETNSLPLIVGCDANSHHEVWGSSNCNNRGKHLIEYISGTQLEILNTGSEWTFANSLRREVIDITLASTSITPSVSSWKVSREDFLSDHRAITFSVCAVAEDILPYRNPKLTNWECFCSYMSDKIKDIDFSVPISEEEIEKLSNNIEDSLKSAFELSCPIKSACKKTSVPWWNEKLARLRKKNRKLFNRAEYTRSDTDWAAYSDCRRAYKEEIRRSKHKSWRKFCAEVEGVQASARMHRILSRETSVRPGAMEIEPGIFSESDTETTEFLLRTHFPDGTISRVPIHCRNSGLDTNVATSTVADWGLAADVVMEERLLWTVNSLTAFKSPGCDGIYPIMVQKCWQLLEIGLKNLYYSCVALGYIPVSWRASRVIFIPKPGRPSYDQAKSFRPICLSSVLLKIFEKLIEWYIKETCLSVFPLHANQHAFQSGKSTESALHKTVEKIEMVLDQKEYSMGTFVDIEGAFDRTTVNSICRALREHGIPETLVRLLSFMLSNRVMVAACGTQNVVFSVSRGCPQGGVLSPLLWCLVVDSLIRLLSAHGFFCVGYADDLVIIVSGKFCSTISDLSQTAMDLIQGWCMNESLSVNPNKSACILFTKNRKSTGLKPIHIFSQVIPKVNNVKYLGVIIDSKLLWREHIQFKTKKALATLWQCRKAFGKTWGLSPKTMHWIYTTIVRPMLVHGAVVWWPRVRLSSVQNELNHLQRVACCGITGALRTTPTAALEVILNISPLYVFIEMTASKTAHRLVINNVWKTDNCTANHKKVWRTMVKEYPVISMLNDTMKPLKIVHNKFCVIDSKREDWLDANCKRFPPPSGIICYTDGSLINGVAGAGIYSSNPYINTYFSLGCNTTVFQAEISAILHCIYELKNYKYVDKAIYICSDSLAAIKALVSPSISSKIVLQCNVSLNELATNNLVKLLWVPSHSGVHGNEVADELAKLGSLQGFVGPEPAVGISNAMIKTKINEWCRETHINLWKNRSDCRQTREFFKEPNITMSKQVLKLPRNLLRLVVGVLTGHCTLNRHLKIMKLTNSDICEKCDYGEEESAIHFLCECPFYYSLRFRVYGKPFITASEVLDGGINCLVKYLKKSERFEL